MQVSKSLQSKRKCQENVGKQVLEEMRHIHHVADTTATHQQFGKAWEQADCSKQDNCSGEATIWGTLAKSRVRIRTAILQFILEARNRKLVTQKPNTCRNSQHKSYKPITRHYSQKKISGTLKFFWKNVNRVTARSNVGRTIW